MGPQDQPDYLNMSVAVDTTLAPEEGCSTIHKQLNLPMVVKEKQVTVGDLVPLI